VSVLAVFTTVDTLDAARAMARALVERRLAACAHVAPVESFYRWQGELHDESEFSVQFKTTAACYPALAAAIRALHSYQLPDIHALVLDEVDPSYARWLEQGSAPEAGNE